MSRLLPLDRIRNVGIVARTDAGKTTTTERILNATTERERGDLDLSDRGITISSAATTCRWRDCAVTIVHTPQSRDLSAETERALKVLDGLVVVLDGSTAGAAGSRAERLPLPRLCFINKMDAGGADFARSVAEAGRQLAATMLVCQLPVYAEGRFAGVIDLVSGEARGWNGALAVPSATTAEAGEMRIRLLQAVGLDAAADAATLEAAIRAAVAEGRAVPVFCGSAYENLGVELLLDAIVAYLPSPADSETVEGLAVGREGAVVRPVSDEAPFAGLTFNSLEDPTVGALTFVRVYSGVLKVGARVLNPSRQAAEEIGRMVRIHANHREDVQEARTGDIVALAGLKHSRAGDTLCDPGEPVIIVAGDLPAKVA